MLAQPKRFESRPAPALGSAPHHALDEPTYAPAPPVNGSIKVEIEAARNKWAYQFLSWGGGGLLAAFVGFTIGLLVEHEFEIIDTSYRISGLEKVVNEIAERLRRVEDRVEDLRTGRPET